MRGLFRSKQVRVPVKALKRTNCRSRAAFVVLLGANLTAMQHGATLSTKLMLYCHHLKSYSEPAMETAVLVLAAVAVGFALGRVRGLAYFQRKTPASVA